MAGKINTSCGAHCSRRFAPGYTPWLSEPEPAYAEDLATADALNFWKLAVAPQLGTICDASDALMLQYADQIPGSKEATEFLMCLVQECQQRIRQTLLCAADRDVCSIEFTTGTCRSIEIALARLGRPTKIITSPFEYSGVITVAKWFASLIGAEVCQLKFEPNDYQRSWISQESKLLDLVQREVRLSRGPSVLILSSVSCVIGVALPIESLLHKLVSNNTSRRLDMIIDGAHAAGNLAPDESIRQSSTYVLSAHKWLLAPEPCGIIVTPRTLRDEEVAYDTWNRTPPATTTNLRIFTSLFSSLCALDRVGANKWREYSISLREQFLQRMRPLFTLVGEESGMQMTALIAVFPRPPRRWKYRADELAVFLETQSVYALVLSIDPTVPWLRLCFPYNQRPEQVDALCNVLELAIE